MVYNNNMNKRNSKIASSRDELSPVVGEPILAQ